MIQYIATALISLAVALTGFIGAYKYMPLGWIDGPLTFGTTLTTIQSTDTLSASRTTLNNNFTALNNGKIEVSTTTLPLLATTLSLSSVGTITTGVWNGTVIGGAYGGTGLASPTSYLVILGNGTAGLTVASSTGTTGQFLTSNGAGAYPSWQTSAVDVAIGYKWTGFHSFTGGLQASSSANNLIASTTIYNLNVGTIYASSSINVSRAQGVRVLQGTNLDVETAGVYYAVPFNSETFDLQNEFNTSTYTFTATSTGYYSIQAVVWGSAAGSPWDLVMYKNNVQYSTSTSILSATSDTPMNLNDSVSLSAGDTIDFEVVASTNPNVDLVITVGTPYLNIFKY